ncbi:MAG: FAD-binding protein [Candidatus Aminicenantes bacterium]|nr:MAG: FAD-binding protein [Candidatus Aminicenantes bacterium]
MSLNEYLISRARKKASRKKRIYGLEPPSAVKDLLARDHTALNFHESFRLFVYILFKSPRDRWKLLWRHLTDRDTPARRNQIDLLARDLKSHVGESCRVIQNFFERSNYSKDLARVPPVIEKMLIRTTPLLVAQPDNEKDIAKILTFCKSRGLSVFPRGTGSFAFGGAVPTRKGIVMDLSPMMAILDVDPEGLAVRVQPGARWADVATKLEPYGLIPMTTPTSRFSTVGGWIATGGMGLDSHAYGNVYESVLGVRVARPNGTMQELNSRSESIKDLFGTEGQLGILTEVTLRVRPKPHHSGPCLLTFGTPDKALKFVEQLRIDKIHPSHVVYFDKEYMKKENILFTEHSGSTEPIVPELDTVLLHFETLENEQAFMSSLNGGGAKISENPMAARYLWSDRYFPLKAQRISPGLLGSEVVIPGEKILPTIRKVKKLAWHFKIKPTVEVIVCRNEENYDHMVILSFSCDYSRRIHYVLSLLFIQLMVRLAVRSGGYPYGMGIWNTPFVRSKYEKDRLDKLKRKKREIDPNEILNPNKFFKIKGRFFGIPALFMRPFIFRTILALSHFFAPVLGLAARLLGPKHSDSWDVPARADQKGRSLLHQSAQRCTSCGSCISVCPAYHITKDELVAGRTKLRMAVAMMNGEELEHAEAHSPFQCLHCGLCEEVCQTHLPLRDCYLVLEDWIATRFGSPVETVQKFVEKLDSNREYIKDIYGLDLPEWSPDEKLSRVPAAERKTEGERV